MTIYILRRLMMQSRMQREKRYDRSEFRCWSIFTKHNDSFVMLFWESDFIQEDE